MRNQLDSVKQKLESYQNASAGASEGLWERNLITDEVFISPPWLTMLGYESNEVEDLKGIWESWMHDDDRERATTRADEGEKKGEREGGGGRGDREMERKMGREREGERERKNR